MRSPEAARDKGGWKLLEKWWEAASWAAGEMVEALPQAGMRFVFALRGFLLAEAFLSQGAEVGTHHTK